MNNPGMDFERWKQLRAKWTELDAKGHKIKVDFQLIAHPTEKNNILAIDVIQHIDGKPIVETVQRTKGKAYTALGIAELSKEQLIEIYKGMLKQLHSQAQSRNTELTVTMTPTSPASGELTGLLEVPDAPVQSPIQLNYQHYYLLKALRDKMVEMTGDAWSQVKAVYRPDELEFYFEY